MAIKAVFFDIDGTLLNDRKNVSQSTVRAIQKLKEQGILVGLATGRGPSFVQPYLENLNLDFAVTYNGQYIISRDQVLYQNNLPVSLTYRVIRYAREKRCEISLGTASGLVGSGIIDLGTSRIGQVISTIVPKKWSKYIGRSFKQFIRRFKPQNSHSLLTIMRQPIYQVVLVASPDETDDIQMKFSDITITRSSPYSADLISKGQSKIRGIKEVGRLFDFKLSEVMAFGDSDNDKEMLAGVGVGVAMGNADEHLKTIASYTTASNNSNGISKALAHYGLIHFDIDSFFKSRDDNFNKVKDFHHLMDGNTVETPRLYGITEASHRADFKVEEIVEFLYATAQGDKTHFTQAILDLHQAIDKAAEKVQQKQHTESPLVGQVDALTDLLYFTYGSFVLMGVDPRPIFSIVHEANMGKIFPDGKSHFHPETHKILKPDDWEERFAPETAIKKELNHQIQLSLNHKSRQNTK